MTSFFQTVRDSIYSPSHYAAVLTSSSGRAVGYFFLLIALLSGIHAIYLGVTQFSGLGSDIEEGIDQVMAGYPPGATVRISDGEVTTTNLQQPYYLGVRTADDEGENDLLVVETERREAEDIAAVRRRLGTANVEGKRNLLVIDTATPFSREQFVSFDTHFWLTSDAVVVDSDGEITPYPLDGVEGFTVDEEGVRKVADTGKLIAQFVTPVLTVLVFMGMVIGGALRLVYLLLAALLIRLAATVMGVSLNYGQAYRVGIYAMTGAFLVELVLTLTSSVQPFRSFLFMFTLVTVGIAVLNLAGVRGLIREEPTNPDAT